MVKLEFGRQVNNRKSITILNPHEGDISTNLLVRILRQAKIDRDDWEQL